MIRRSERTEGKKEEEILELHCVWSIFYTDWDLSIVGTKDSVFVRLSLASGKNVKKMKRVIVEIIIMNLTLVQHRLMMMVYGTNDQRMKTKQNEAWGRNSRLVRVTLYRIWASEIRSFFVFGYLKSIFCTFIVSYREQINWILKSDKINNVSSLISWLEFKSLISRICQIKQVPSNFPSWCGFGSTYALITILKSK